MSPARSQSDQPEPEVPLLIQGLVGELPPRGKPFGPRARERWLAALKVSLDLIYGDDDDTDEV
jgi:hypothetical protein